MDAIDALIPAGIGTLSFALDEAGATFLALFGFLWIVSGVYSWVTTPPGERARLFAYYVPSAAGGITVALAADAISFYLCFALMAIPAWGLITHSRSAESRRAGAIYLTLTAIGEALLLAALILMATGAGSLALTDMRAGVGASVHAEVIVLLLLGSIGLKIGTLPVFGILPLSYTYTPAGAASALAGASAKVGALAMIRLLPADAVPAQWISAVMLIGLATAFAAAMLGVLTTTPRAILGYSSASQMGLVLIGAAAGLGDSSATPLAHGAIVAFALHHGLAKSALVLGADVASRVRGRARTVALTALALPALALVGVPLSSGFVAKYALKDVVHTLYGPVPETVYALLPLTAIGTAALMLRFFALVRADAPIRGTSARIPAVLWGLVLTATATAVWVWPAEFNLNAIKNAVSPGSLWTATWPALAALALWRLSRLIPAVSRRLDCTLVPGDLLISLATIVRTLDGALRADPGRPAPARTSTYRLGSALTAAEGRMVTWTVASTVFTVLTIVLIALASA